MSTNEAARRALWIVMDDNGLPKPGAPGGPLAGKSLKITRATARGPLPTPANQLVPASPSVLGRLLHNLDDGDTIWFSDKPNVTDQTGATLKANSSIPVQFNGPIYIYCLNGSPLVECIEVLPS